MTLEGEDLVETLEQAIPLFQVTGMSARGRGLQVFDQELKVAEDQLGVSICGSRSYLHLSPEENERIA